MVVDDVLQLWRISFCCDWLLNMSQVQKLGSVVSQMTPVELAVA